MASAEGTRCRAVDSSWSSSWFCVPSISSIIRERCAMTRAKIFDKIRWLHSEGRWWPACLYRPFHEIQSVCFKQGSDNDAKLITPRITFLNLNVGRESRVNNGFVGFRLLPRFPTWKLFPMTTIFRKESLTNGISRTGQGRNDMEKTATSIAKKESFSMALKNWRKIKLRRFMRSL
jgi:hypothetical protein